MGNSKKMNSTTRFLICSFIGLLVFSIIIFSLLGVYMSRKSKNTVYEIGNIYMSGMNEQMSRHFETVIKLRFDQVSGIVSVVSVDNNEKEKLYEELLNVKELTKPTYHDKIMIATVREYDYDEVKERIQNLIEMSYTYDQMKIVAAMKDIVPEFVSKNSCFEALDKKD